MDDKFDIAIKDEPLSTIMVDGEPLDENTVSMRKLTIMKKPYFDEIIENLYKEFIHYKKKYGHVPRCIFGGENLWKAFKFHMGKQYAFQAPTEFRGIPVFYSTLFHGEFEFGFNEDEFIRQGIQDGMFLMK